MYENPVLHQVNSDCYGAYMLECIGVVDFLGISDHLDLDALCAWMEKMHPSKYFVGYTMVLLHPHAFKKGQFVRGNRVAMFVPTARANEDWCVSARRSGHYKGRKRKLPIISTELEIIKWQESIPGSLLKPEWLNDCKSVEDIIAMDRKLNPGPCHHCYFDGE